jgi:NCS1 family nucleobase:cation symporter-1
MKLWNESYWQPADILAHWENRGAVFVAAVIWIIATIGVNLSANTITVAIALSSFWPKYINNVRGALLVALLSIIICPWKIVYSAGSFYSESNTVEKPRSSLTFFQTFSGHTLRYSAL